MPIDPALEPEDRALDDDLAHVTDQILSGKPGAQSKMDDSINANLLGTVQRIHVAVKNEHPDSSMSVRIQARLRQEWSSVLRERRERRMEWKWPKLVFAGAFLIVALIIFIFVGIPDVKPLPGAAFNFSSWAPLFVLLGVVFIVILLWIDRRR
jgi:hypothetical protein